MRRGGRLMLRKYVLLMPLLAIVVQGCGSGGSGDVTELQQQIAMLASQVEETRKEMDTMRQTNQELGKLLDTLQTEVSSLLKEEKILPAPGARVEKREEKEVENIPDVADTDEVLSPDTPVPTPRDKIAPSEELGEPLPQSTAQVSCTRVWGLLGRGQDAKTVARTLKITVEDVQACEQGVGRGGR